MKIFITGNSGCGKTTSANKIAEKYNIPVCSLDDFVWQDNVVPSVKREYSERKKLLDEFLKNESWVIEGMSHSEWMLDVYRLADLIFLYETSLKIILITADLLSSFTSDLRLKILSLYLLIECSEAITCPNIITQQLLSKVYYLLYHLF